MRSPLYVPTQMSLPTRMPTVAPCMPVVRSEPATVREASVELVFDPPWRREMMSPAAQLQTGMM